MQCECGMLRLKFGAVVVELDAEDFTRLHELMGRAVAQLGLQPPPPPPDISRAH